MTIAPDVLIVGGGVIGLSIALELRLQGVSVTVLTRDVAQAATQAAAGMLAPQAEQLPPGLMLDLCLWSRSLYPEWIRKLESLTGLNAGYWACGILAPVYGRDESGGRRDEIRTYSSFSPHLSSFEHWLDRAAIHQHQSGLSSEVEGGWWYPDDAQVDNRALAKALWVAAQAVGVQIQAGVIVHQVQQQNQQVIAVETSAGRLQAGHYVVATGAWSQDLLPVPVLPRKGQMLSVQVPQELRFPELQGASLPLQTVLFGSEIYIVPRQDGRTIIGATSEDVGFAPNNTSEEIQALRSHAIRLYPPLREFPIQECWWGFRPATPDDLPILGASPCTNLSLAIGHYRNGILLAPATAALMANWILHQSQNPLLEAFHWSRFAS